MAISIPETVKYYCESKANTESISLFYDKGEQPTTSLEELEKYGRSCLYLDKFIYDMWKFRFDLWRAVWADKLKDYSIQNICGYNEIHETFWIIYKLNDKKYYFSVSCIDCNTEDDDLFVLASYVDENDKENAIGEDSEYTRKEDDEDESYTRSKHQVSVRKVTEITDKDIAEFRKAADEILEKIGIK